ncbi:MAG: hypothetical protein N3A72_09120 [bacterium]|nr:hypothetical protein [bacterium]
MSGRGFGEMLLPMKAIYGLKSDLSQFLGLTPEQVADQLKSWGITAVFGGYENQELVAALHKQRISVYAEIAIFAGEKYWKSHPESRPITDKGIPLEKDQWYAGVCPNQDWLREEKLNQIRTLCRNYQVDGIWLDFIRYPCHWEVKQPRFDRTCFCRVCLNKFQKETGIRIPNHLTSVVDTAKWLVTVKKDEWNKWRCQQITSFVQQARKVIKQENPQIVVGMFGVPWREQEVDFNYAIIEYIAQDYRALAKEIDIFSPMVYHKMCGHEIGWITDITKYLADLTNRPVVPIVQACSIPETIDNMEFSKVLTAGLAEPSSGVIIFTLDYLNKENKIETMKSILNPKSEVRSHKL